MAQWGRVSRSNPCKICGKADYCSFSLDGEVAKCCRVCSEKKVSSRNGVGEGWIHRFANPVAVRVEVEKPKRHTRRKLREMANEMHEEGLSRLPWLAENLGVSVESLIALRVGWRRGAYSLPERDEHGKVVGISLRTPEGRKFSEKGGTRGLATHAGCLSSRFLVLPEGHSDVAAAYTAGFNSVGRPTTSGCLPALAAVIARQYAASTVIVMGENDAKDESTRDHWPCGRCGCCPLCWPGLYGGRETWKYLTESGIKCSLAMPPAGVKDIRGMLKVAGKIEIGDMVFLEDNRRKHEWW